MAITKETFQAIEKVHSDLVDAIKQEMLKDVNDDLFEVLQSLKGKTYPFSDKIKMLSGLVDQSSWVLTQIDSILSSSTDTK